MIDDELDVLRAKADDLGREDVDEAVAVNEAILRHVAGDLVATRRLALALLRGDEVDRADEVVQEALASHPEDTILRARAADVDSARRRVRSAAAAAGTTRRRDAVARSPSTWIKAIHHTPGSDWSPAEVGQELWLSDPGQRDAQGRRRYTAGGDPFGRPSWRVGEEVGVYLGGTARVPMLVRITATPSFEPAFVQAADWAQDGDGERWPWVTAFEVVDSAPLDRAPTLDDLGIAAAAMQQRARLLTDPTIHGRLVQALRAAR